MAGFRRLGRGLKAAWKAARLVLCCLLALILLGNLYVMITDAPSVFGWSWAVVLSGSMEPEISVDDLIVTRAQKSYRVGDIVMYETGGTPVTHRIVGEAENGFITQGDANNTADAKIVEEAQIVGRVILAVPRVGLVLGWLKTPLGLLSVVLIGAVLIEGPYLLEKSRKERGKDDEADV